VQEGLEGLVDRLGRGHCHGLCLASLTARDARGVSPRLRPRATRGAS
jgi:hypothetical protein